MSAFCFALQIRPGIRVDVAGSATRGHAAARQIGAALGLLAGAPFLHVFFYTQNQDISGAVRSAEIRRCGGLSRALAGSLPVLVM